MANIQIEKAHRSIILDILNGNPKIRALKVFGSRARGSARRFSDLDILLETNSALDFYELSALENAISDSEIPYRVDLVDSSRISAEFFSSIEGDLSPIEGTKD
jgi:predicted nucleotidyltransferase